MEVINNVSKKLNDDLKEEIKSDSRLSIAAACFSIYAFEELRKELEGIEELRFIFTSPSFTTEKTSKERKEFYIPRLNRERSITGTEFEIKLRNELSQKAIARECADWIRRKVKFKSNTTDEAMMGFMNVDDISYMPITGFTTADLGCEKGNNAYSMINKFESPFSNEYIKLFNSLWNSDKLEDVTDKFRNDLQNNSIAEFKQELKPLREGVLNLVQAIYDPNAFKRIIKDASKEKVERNSLTQRFYLPEFQKLWNSINYRYSFTVKIDTQEVIKKSIAEINSSLNIQTQKYKLVKGQQKDSLTIDNVREKAGFNSPLTTSRDVEYHGSSSLPFDLIGNIARKARLTKKTVIEIICGIDKHKFDMFKLNPEAFASQVSDIISHEVRHSMVAHIAYTKHDGNAYPDSIFEEDGIGREKAEAFIGKYHNVQEYIFPDGTSVESVERTFARHLDEEKEIVAFAKLPRKFSIPTPGGNYTPDWAIVFNENENIKHLYFIAETKGSTDPDDLRTKESIKIQCLKRLCNAISLPGITYDVVSDFTDLLEQARK